MSLKVSVDEALRGTDPAAQQQALQSLLAAEPAVLGQHAAALLDFAGRTFQSHDAVEALQLLGRLDPIDVEKHVREVKEFAYGMDDGQIAPALRIIGKLEPAKLAIHASLIASKLHEDHKEQVWVAAIEAIGQLEPVELAKYSRVIAEKGLQYRDIEVNIASLRALARLEPSSLASFGSHIAEVVNTRVPDDTELRRCALETLRKLEQEELKAYANVLIKAINDPSTRFAALGTLNCLGTDILAFHVDLLVEMLFPPKGPEVTKKETESFCSGNIGDVPRFALKMLERVDPIAMRSHVPGIIEQLHNPDVASRKSALQVIENLGAEILQEHRGAIVGVLEGEVSDAQGEVVAMIDNLDANSQEVFAEPALRLLQQSSTDAQGAGIALFNGFDAGVIARHIDALLDLWQSEDVQVRGAAIKAFCEDVALDNERVSVHIDKILQRMKEMHVDVLPSIFQMLCGWLDATMAGNADVICSNDLVPVLLEQAGCDNAGVRDASAEVVRRLLSAQAPPKVVLRAIEEVGKASESLQTTYAREVLEGFAHESEAVRQEALRVLAQAGSGVLEGVSASVCEWVAHHLPEARLATTLLITRRRFELMNSKLPMTGDLPLHVAAANGHLDLCEILIDAGSLLRAKNLKGQTPAAMALAKGHEDVHRFLLRKRNIETVRGGTGDAVEIALKDERPVVEVEWYNISIPGIAGKVGAFHSLLAITVAADTAEGGDSAPHTYVIEKASDRRASSGESEGDHFLNGVYISHWLDVSSNVEDDPLHSLPQSDIVSALEFRQAMGVNFCMRSLRQIAVDLGPYNVGTANCHHAALAIYNACAKQSAQVLRIPNQLLTGVANFLGKAGVDVGKSESAKKFNSASANVEFVSAAAALYEGGSDLARSNLVCEYDHRWAVPASQASLWIYRISNGAISVHNALDQELVVFAEETKEKLRLQPGESGDINARGEKVTVRVNRLGLFDLTSLRTRLAREELLAENNYRIEAGASSSEVSVVPIAPLPSTLTKQHLDLAGAGNLVQWAVLTDADTVYVTFRGTADFWDVIIDMNFMTYDYAEHGLSVQSAVWTCLHKKSHHVVEMSMQEVRKLRQARPELANLVVTGHSLGGAYAIVAGLDMLHLGLDVTRVITFGCPQVIVPDRENAIWKRMNELSILYVNAFDIIPRMPSCEDWVFEVLPMCGAFTKKIGALKVGLENKVTEFVADKFRPQFVEMEKYDTVGTLVHIGTGSRAAGVHPNTPDGSHRRVLSKKPTQLGIFVVENHFMMNYVSVVAGLRRPEGSSILPVAFSDLSPV